LLSTRVTGLCVDLTDDGVADLLEFLLLLIVVLLLSIGVLGEPILGVLECVLDGFLIIITELVGQLLRILDLVLHGVDVALE